MNKSEAEKPVRERLILAGIDEINRYGIQHFSVRRVAKVCGVSCASPYKHFKDRQEFFAAIVQYINELWHERQKKAADKAGGDPRQKLLAISGEYIRFLVENPYFRSIIMLKDEAFDSDYSKIRSDLSRLSKELVAEYCALVGMDDTTRMLKTFIVRSLIYGAALMFDNGELSYDDKTFALVLQSIDREFDLD